MRHQYIEENQIVDRYLMDQLAPREREDFEDHYLHCKLCQDDVEASQVLQTGLKTAAARGWLKPLPDEEVRGSGSGGRAVPLWTLAAAAALAALLLLPPIYLLMQMNDLDGQLAQTRQQLDQARQDARQQTLQAGRLDQELRDLRSQQGQEEAGLQDQLAQERQARRQLAGDLRRLSRPQINTPVIPLDVLRGSGEQAATVVRPDENSSWVVLSMLLDRTGFTGYRVQLQRDGRTVWQSDGLRPNYRDELVLNLPVDMLSQGTYQMSLEGLREDGSRRSIGRYAFTFQP